MSVYQADDSDKAGNNYHKYQDSGYIKGNCDRNGLNGGLQKLLAEFNFLIWW